MNTESANHPFKAEEELPAANDWIQRLIGFAAQCENEGILGLAQATVEQTTSLTFQVASAVTSTACHIVSEAGRAMIQQSHLEEEGNYNVPLQHATQEVVRESTQQEEAPFLIKIAFQFTDIVLATISPALSSKNTSMPKACNNGTELRLLQDVDMLSTKSYYSEEFYDAHSCAADECSVFSVYFDADATVSTCSESDETNDTGSLIDKSSSDETEESQSCIIECIPDMLYATAQPSPTYFLDLPDGLLSKMDNDIEIPLMKCDNNVDECFAFNSDASKETYVQAVLDALVRHSVDLLDDNNPFIKWQADDTTKKIFQQNTSNSYEDIQWTRLLEERVLKWTSHGENTPMLKTRGIVNMTPTQLNSLLLDCTRVQEYNKCSIGKKDLCAFNLLRGGEAKIVEHVMGIPIVGGKVETLSLTHSRPLLDDSAGFLIVSRSVKQELNDTVGNPCFSISSMRSIAGTDKTELTTLTSISLHVPKFLMHRVAFYGADDFFGNLRKIT